MANALPDHIDVKINVETIAFLNDFARRIEKLAKALTPIAEAKELAAGQSAPAPVREEDLPDRYRRQLSTLRDQRDKAVAYAQDVRDELAQVYALGREERRLLSAERDDALSKADKARGEVQNLRQDLNTARQRAQHDVTRWRDAEAEIKRLQAIHRCGDGNVLEANAQLRAENDKLINDRDDLEAEVARLRVYERTVDSLGKGTDGEMVNRITELEQQLSTDRQEATLARQRASDLRSQLHNFREMYDADARTYQEVLAERDRLEASRTTRYPRKGST